MKRHNLILYLSPLAPSPQAGRGMGVGFMMLPLLIMALLLVSYGESAPETPTLLRVAILEGVKQVTLEAQGSVLVKDKSSPSSGRVTHGPLSVKANGSKLSLGGRDYHSLQVLPPEGGKILVNNKGYRGFLEIHPQGKDALMVINVIEVEDYLPGVLRGEASPQWPREALLTQAVLARTYALSLRQENEGQLFHLKATIASQVYGGAAREDARLKQAVAETRGLVLSYRGQVIPAFYHATCGGRTEDASLVWPKAPAYMKGVACNYCRPSPHYSWKAELALEQIRKALASNGAAIGQIKGWRILETSPTGRITRLSIEHSQGQYALEGEKLRKFVGYDVIRSTNFSVYNRGGKAHFSGRGWGHGAGLCQWGAKGMAEKAYNYQQILQYYFPYAEIVKIY